MGTDKTIEVSAMPGIAKTRPRKRRAAPTKAGEVVGRTSEYRGQSLAEARAAYYADARAMSRMGYAPASEEWATVLEHVLTVRYVFEPGRQPAVLAALDAMEADPEGASPEPRPPATPTRFARSLNLWLALPLELRLSAGGIAGVAVGLVLCLAAGLLSGDSPDLLSLLGFGTIGLLLGASVGLIHAEGL
jgi:hypothetical protein